MNAVFLGAVLIAFVVAGYRQVTVIPAPDAATPMDALGLAMIDAAKGSVTLAIGLVGVMALFLGLMKVAEAGGLLAIIAKTVRPLMVRLFPEVPADHPAMGAMIMNICRPSMRGMLSMAPRSLAASAMRRHWSAPMLRCASSRPRKRTVTLTL